MQTLLLLYAPFAHFIQIVPFQIAHNALLLKDKELGNFI
jgi:hypothetical protein